MKISSRIILIINCVIGSLMTLFSLWVISLYGSKSILDFPQSYLIIILTSSAACAVLTPSLLQALRKGNLGKGNKFKRYAAWRGILFAFTATFLNAFFISLCALIFSRPTQPLNSIGVVSGIMFTTLLGGLAFSIMCSPFILLGGIFLGLLNAKLIRVKRS